MTDKPKVVFGVLSSCFGCLMSFLNIDEELPGVLAKVDLRRSPLNDLKVLEPVKIGILEGAVATEEDVELAKTMRENAEVLIALGTCADFGGIGGLRNLEDVSLVEKNVYGGKRPDEDGLSRLLPKVMPVAGVVDVDIMVRGCPPNSSDILQAIESVLADVEVPPLYKKNLCNQCPREKKGIMKSQRGFLTEGVKAVMELAEIDPNRCFLEQGVLCSGLVTVEGCGARCLNNNMPCRGCYGPATGVHGQGNKYVNVISSLLPVGGIMINEDIVGTGYRYSLGADNHFQENE